MHYLDAYARDLVYVALVLAAFAIAGLVYAAVRARSAVLGDMLLKANGGDLQSALLAIENSRAEFLLMTHRDPRVRRRWFHRDMTR